MSVEPEGPRTTVSKNMSKGSIFFDSASEKSDHDGASINDEGTGQWKVARRKRRGKHCKDCVTSEECEKGGSRTQLKDKIHEKEWTEKNTSKECEKGGSREQQKEETQEKERMEKNNICRGTGNRQCGKPVRNNKAGGIGCDICMGWFHPQCQDMTDEAYKLLKGSDLVWLCSFCREQLPSLRGIMKKKAELVRTREIEELDRKLEDLRKGQVELHNRLEETMLSCANRIENSVEHTARDTKASLINNTEEIVAKSSYQQMVEVTNKIEKVTEVQLTRFGQVERTVGNSVASLEKVVVESQKTALSLPRITEEVKSSADKVRKILEREADEARKKNILVHNIKESKSQDPRQQRDDDEQAVQTIASALLGVGNVLKIERIVRLGKRKEDTDARPRLLLVTLDGTDQVDLMYHKRFGLKEAGFANTYITKDLPPAEREEQRRLREELASRGKEHYCIFRGAVIPRADRRLSAKK